MAQIKRLAEVLAFIHQHLEEPLSLEMIAQKSCWSRWQLQRVFSEYTKVSVAQYIRELKLSRAAELLVSTQMKSLDIAIMLGFNSEISFSRAFKQFFGQSPRAYRKQGILTGIRKPFSILSVDKALNHSQESFKQIRIETKPAFSLIGCHDEIQGVLSQEPNFAAQVPLIWQKFYDKFQPLNDAPRIGVIDTRQAESLTYWAGIRLTKDIQFSTQDLKPFDVSQCDLPKQTYAVFTHVGNIEALAQNVIWLLTVWLPESGYEAIDGFELEIYPADYQYQGEASRQMEYWLPIQAVKL